MATAPDALAPSTAKTPTMRAFLALPVPDDTAAALVRLQSELPSGRPVPEENLHLTLAFLGEVGDDLLDELHLGLASAALGAAPVRFSGLTGFPSRDGNLLVADVAPDPALVRLHGRVTRIIRAAGIALSRRRFRPHVTLMRGARRGLATDLPGIPPYIAGALILYRSTLGSGHARHDAIARYPLVPEHDPSDRT